MNAYDCYPLFESPLITAGVFRCHPSHARFANTGPARGHLVVFPRTCVRIIQDGHRPMVADPNVVVFYNAGQEYRREAISQQGDRCEFYHFASAIVADAMRPFDRTVDERPERPFRFNRAFSEARVYLMQRLLFRTLSDRSVTVDRLQVEETLLTILAESVASAHSSDRRSPIPVSPTTRREHVDLVRETQALLAARFRDRLSLQEMAEHVVSSPYHLCRLFRQHTGLTIHEYQNQLRLRTALDMLEDNTYRSLTRLALELGFASHSHFSTAFRRCFGLPPSQFGMAC